MNEASVHEDSLDEVCERITDYYMVERYPGSADAGLTEERVRRSLQEVNGLIDWLRQNTAGR